MRDATRRELRVDLPLLAVATVLLRLPVFVVDRVMTFDESVYGASAVAMRHGGLPYRDVFSSQGPLFLPLVWIADLMGLRTTNAPRVLAMAAALVLVFATYVGGRAISDRAGALLAAGLVTSTASVLWVTGPIAADGVALALATVTVALTLRWRDRVDLRRAVWLGLAVGATVSVKALLIAVVLPVGLVLFASGRLRLVLAGALTALAFHFALWLPWGPARVWDQSYLYHLEVAGERTPGANLAKVLSTLGDRDLPQMAAAALALVAYVVTRAAPRAAIVNSRPATTTVHKSWARHAAKQPEVLLLAWLAGTVLVLATEHPLWRPHVSHLLPAVALLVARYRPPWTLLVAVAIVLLPYHLVRGRSIFWPRDATGAAAEFVERLAALPDDALVISDEPGLAWRAGRQTPPEWVDTSILQLESERITPSRLAAEAAREDVCAVVVWTRAGFVSFDELPQLLADEGYQVELEDGHRRLYARGC
jgi:hypothetical protein